MSLFDRLSFLLRSDANGMIDALENKNNMLKQALREVEDAVARLATDVQHMRDELQARQRQRERLQPELARLDRDIDLCLQQDQEQLASFAAKKYVPLQRQAASLDERCQQLTDSIASREAELTEQRHEVEQLRQQVADALAANAHSTNAHGEADSFSAATVPDVHDEVALELLRRRQQQNQPASQEGVA